MASYPGPGYTRTLDYDEEGRLTKISRLTGGVTTPKFEYAYGFDGGRRWRKDLDGDVWNWYPCGVACCAGELVVLEATISGTQTWTAASSILPTLSGASHDGSAFTTSPTSFLSREIAGGSPQGSVTADQFGVLRGTTGTGSTYYGGWLPSARDDEAIAQKIAGTGIAYQQQQQHQPLPKKYKVLPRNCAQERIDCRDAANNALTVCYSGVLGVGAAAIAVCIKGCSASGPGSWACLLTCLGIDALFIGFGLLGCWWNYQRMLGDCDDIYRDCLKSKGIIIR